MNDDDLKQLLEENLKTSRESLKILKEINSARKWARFFWFLKWGIIIGLLVFGFIKLQPYIEPLSNNIKQISEFLIKFENVLPK